jgi:hypothetical protein
MTWLDGRDRLNSPVANAHDRRIVELGHRIVVVEHAGELVSDAASPAPA